MFIIYRIIMKQKKNYKWTHLAVCGNVDNSNEKAPFIWFQITNRHWQPSANIYSALMIFLNENIDSIVFNELWWIELATFKVKKNL